MSFPKIEGYMVVEKLGSGTYSTVYKAFNKVSRHHYHYLHPSGGICQLALMFSADCGSSPFPSRCSRSAAIILHAVHPPLPRSTSGHCSLPLGEPHTHSVL